MHAHSLLLYIDFNDASDVVWHYQQKQANDRAGSSSKSRNRSSATSPIDVTLYVITYVYLY